MRSQLSGTVEVTASGPVYDERLGLVYSEDVEFVDLDFSGWEERIPATYLDPPEMDGKVELETTAEKVMEQAQEWLSQFDEILTPLNPSWWRDSVEEAVEEYVWDDSSQYVD